jgi:hypothetical protein
VEDEVIREMKDHMEDYKAKNYRVWGGSITGRLDDLELARERVEEKATCVDNHLTAWMETFSALEIGIGSNVECIKMAGGGFRNGWPLTLRG